MNKWMETVLYYKNKDNLTLMQAIKKAKFFYIKEADKKRFEKTFGIKFTI